MDHFFYYETEIGAIGIRENGAAITHLGFASDLPTENALCEETALTKLAASELMAYFAGAIRCFSLPLAPKGTEFQKKVWQALCQIPYGETKSYKEIAEMIGHRKAFRAVGMANHHNPIMIVIPCHRVIAADGGLGGYGGGLPLKIKLLTLEKSYNKINA